MSRYLDLEMLSKQPLLMAAVSTAAGLLYLATASMQILRIMGLVGFWFLTPDVVIVFLLLVLAGVFLSGVLPLKHGKRHAIAFPTVGLILSALLFVLKIAILLTNALGWILSFEDWQTWSLAMDFEPTLWTFPIIIGMFAVVSWYSSSSTTVENGVDTHDT